MNGFIDGAAFCRIFASGAAAIANAAQEVNELNVFPVPDGDTGSNMSMTMSAGLKNLNGSYAHAGQAAGAAAQGLLRGARGNSGVILSLLFRGFAKGVKERESIDGTAFAAAMSDGVDTAYRAVMKPAEGTVLTVTRVSSRAAVIYSGRDSNLERVMEHMLACAEEAVKETVTQNEVLAKAGVVDAGAYGFCIILKGMLEALRGNPVLPADDTQPASSARFSDFTDEDIRFAYCTEFMVKRPRAVPGQDNDPSRLRAYLESCGDSLVFVEDDDIIKVHVHTNDPGRALTHALPHGELTAVKIENMREQHTEQILRENGGQTASVPGGIAEKGAAPQKDVGFVSVCAGKGLEAVMRDLGVDEVVEGGQTMNPSTQDILDKIKLVGARTVFVLPNNKNIIMAAEQCAALSDRQIIVLPSKSVPQGIAAMLAYNAGEDAEANRAAMTGALKTVTTLQITAAARDSQFDGSDIAEGDNMLMADGALAFSHPSRLETLRAAADMAAKKGAENITIFLGDCMAGEGGEAEEAVRIFERYAPGASVISLEGGQPVYSYIISVE
ncbi:MAG: DAK2 domain-containing protein [Oscillospiraceae bacterium]|nr:DAK2 domain-containing protein [Oscillospiraceae bacterium]